MASPEFLSEFSKQIAAHSKWIQLERTESTGPGGPEDVRIPGGGFAAQLFQFLSHQGIPTAILLRFCSEGDNIPDAIALMTYLCQWIGLKSSDTKVPNSWKFLFGKPAPITLY